jgi:hypothetical protein
VSGHAAMPGVSLDEDAELVLTVKVFPAEVEATQA